MPGKMGKLILIIDDDPDYSQAIKGVLESKGYNVDTSSDSVEGLKKLEAVKPDLIILDVMMKTKDEGFNFARKIKFNEQYKKIPILMLTAIKEATGFDFKQEAGDGKWLPVDDYCDKLIEMEDLVEKVEKLLN